MTTADHNLFLTLNFDGGQLADLVFWHISGKVEWIPLYVLILWLLYRRLGWWHMLLAAGLVIVAVVAADHIANFFKTDFPRPRPSRTPGVMEFTHIVNGYRGGQSGTVSAHAAIACSIAVSSLSLIRSRIYTCLIILWVILICYSRIYLGVHFPFDILFGAVDGTLLALLAIWIYRKTEKRIRV